MLQPFRKTSHIFCFTVVENCEWTVNTHKGHSIIRPWRSSGLHGSPVTASYGVCLVSLYYVLYQFIMLCHMEHRVMIDRVIKVFDSVDLWSRCFSFMYRRLPGSQVKLVASSWDKPVVYDCRIFVASDIGHFMRCRSFKNRPLMII